MLLAREKTQFATNDRTSLAIDLLKFSDGLALDAGCDFVVFRITYFFARDLQKRRVPSGSAVLKQSA